MRSLSQSLFSDYESGIFRQITLAAEPVLHVGSKPIEWDTGPGFDQSIADRKRVVKNGIVGEISHGKTVEPLQRHGMAQPTIFEFDFDFPREHDDSSADIVNPRRGRLGLRSAALFGGVQSLFQAVHFFIELLRQMRAEFVEVIADQRNLGEPAIDVNTEKLRQ